ncbi:MAG TPA: hypothetical protein VKP65_15380, partial [Rhodothermales bacterium]|nr:hypothetical protein [Rhodothermales bacterium]
RRSDLALYSADGFHPSPMGSYLAALVIYAGLLDVPPGDVPTTLSLAGDQQVTIPTSVARIFKEAAAEVLAARNGP